MPGFETEKSEAVTVNIGGIANYDFKLRTGAATQSITVTGQEGGLETDKISVDTNVTTQQLEELPLNGRNFTSIAGTGAGSEHVSAGECQPGRDLFRGSDVCHGRNAIYCGRFVPGFS